MLYNIIKENAEGGFHRGTKTVHELESEELIMITFGKTDINTGLIPWKLDGQWIMDTPHSVWRCEDGDDIYYIIKRRGECIGTYGTLLEVANDLARLEANRLQEGRR